MLAELRKEIAWLHAGLLRHARNLVAEDVLQLVGRDRMVGTAADPGLHHVAEAGLLELRNKPAETRAAEHPADAAALCSLSRVVLAAANKAREHAADAGLALRALVLVVAAHQAADDVVENAHDLCPRFHLGTGRMREHAFAETVEL